MHAWQSIELELVVAVPTQVYSLSYLQIYNAAKQLINFTSKNNVLIPVIEIIPLVSLSDLTILLSEKR